MIAQPEGNQSAYLFKTRFNYFIERCGRKNVQKSYSINRLPSATRYAHAALDMDGDRGKARAEATSSARGE